MTGKSLGGRQIVWGMALSALLAITGHEVLAGGRLGSRPQQTGQATPPPQTTASPSAPMGRPGGPSGGRFGGPRCGGSLMDTGWEWWKDERTKKEMGLRPDQATRIDNFYNDRMKRIDPFVQEADKEQVVLDKMFADRTVDESTLSLQVLKVSNIRTSIIQSRILMLYRMAKVLDAEQYAKLKAIHDRHTQEVCGGRGGGGGLRPGPAALPR